MMLYYIFFSCIIIQARRIVTKPYLSKYMNGILPLYWKIGNTDSFPAGQLHKRIFNKFPINNIILK